MSRVTCDRAALVEAVLGGMPADFANADRIDLELAVEAAIKATEIAEHSRVVFVECDHHMTIDRRRELTAHIDETLKDTGVRVVILEKGMRVASAPNVEVEAVRRSVLFPCRNCDKTLLACTSARLGIRGDKYDGTPALACCPECDHKPRIEP